MWAGLGLDWEQEGHGAGGCLIGKTSKGTLKTFPHSLSFSFLFLLFPLCCGIFCKPEVRRKSKRKTNTANYLGVVPLGAICATVCLCQNVMFSFAAVVQKFQASPRTYC